MEGSRQLGPFHPLRSIGFAFPAGIDEKFGIVFPTEVIVGSCFWTPDWTRGRPCTPCASEWGDEGVRAGLASRNRFPGEPSHQRVKVSTIDRRYARAATINWQRTRAKPLSKFGDQSITLALLYPCSRQFVRLQIRSKRPACVVMGEIYAAAHEIIPFVYEQTIGAKVLLN